MQTETTNHRYDGYTDAMLMLYENARADAAIEKGFEVCNFDVARHLARLLTEEAYGVCFAQAVYYDDTSNKGSSAAGASTCAYLIKERFKTKYGIDSAIAPKHNQLTKDHK